MAALREGFLPKRKVCGNAEAFPRSGEGGCDQREQSDEGAGKQLLSGNYPSFGATRHLFPPFVAMRHFPPARGKSVPKGEGFGGGCMVSGSIARCAASPEALPLGELARKRLRGRGRCPQRRAFAESGAANAVFRHDPSRENGIPESPQTLRYSEIKKLIP